MPSGKTNYLENALLNHVLRGIAYAPPSSLWFALFTSEVDDNTTVPSEVTADDYTRQQVTFAAPFEGSIANNNILDFGVPDTNWGTLVAVGIYDASTDGNLLYYATKASATNMTTNTNVIFQIGDIVIVES